MGSGSLGREELTDMKKIFILALAVLMAGSMAACGMGDVGGSSSPSSGTSSSQASSSSPASSAPDAQSYSDNLEGLEKYLAAGSVLSGSPTDMKAEFIGAAKGAKYQFDFNGKSNVTVELYEFDPAGGNDTAKAVQNAVRKDGNFTIMSQKVPAVLSDSGKYLMIYRDTVTDKSENKQREEQTVRLLKEFKK